MAVQLEPRLRRRLGIGNSTGLGMAPFLINHPALIHAWILARETALARVRSLPSASAGEQAMFRDLLGRARLNAESWHSAHPIQQEKVAALLQDLSELEAHVNSGVLDEAKPWNLLHEWAEAHLSLEGQEQLVSLMIEPYGEQVDHLAASMCADESAAFRIDGTMKIADLQAQTEAQYAWAMAIDFEDRKACAHVWYTSEEKLEPRLGERFEEDIEAYEQPLAPGRDAKRLLDALADWKPNQTIAEFLLMHPEHRHMVRRIQLIEKSPYGEIHDNTIDADVLPIDLLRCKLSFFGATRFDPRSDRWVRITMFQDAPYPEELAFMDPDDGFYPPSGQA